MRGRLWLIAPSEPVDDLEGGKERAAAHAQEYREFGTAASALEGIAIRVVSIGSVGQLCSTPRFAHSKSRLTG